MSVFTGKICAYGLLRCAASTLTSNARSAPTAASGAVNRPGKWAPAANPRALTATTPAAPTATGHHSGPPQVTCRAVTPYRTATQPSEVTIAPPGGGGPRGGT